MIKLCFYNYIFVTGSLVLVTSPGGNQDKVWCLSGDLFPIQRCLSETQSIVPLDGAAWALDEMIGEETPYTTSTPAQPIPPLVVRQYYEPAAKFVILTPNVSEVDILLINLFLLSF